MKLQDLHKDSNKYLSAGQVAEIYGINRSSVITACNKGRMDENEAVNTVLGWLISPAGAKRLWGDRRIEIKDERKMNDNGHTNNIRPACQ